MGHFRTWLAHHRAGAIWLVAAALFMKIAVPAGYMPMLSGEAIVIEPCSGYGAEAITMAMPGMNPDLGPGMSDHRGKTDRSDKQDIPCGFAGHAPAAMAGADPILLVLAIGFIVATVFRMPALWSIRRAHYLRPPLRGPPAIA